MRGAVLIGLICFFALAMIGFSQQQTEPASNLPVPTTLADEDMISQLETDLLDSEMKGDAGVVAKTFADDWVNIIPNGDPGPTKASLLEGAQDHPNHAPPYTATQQQMHVYVFGDTAAAIYVKEYTAKRSKNIVRLDVTDIFTRNEGTWKLRLTRTSAHQEPGTNARQ